MQQSATLSSATGRGHQLLQQPGSVNPGSGSTISSQGGAHWEGVACCGAPSAGALTQSHLLARHQPQNQVQAGQLGYFQIHKSGNSPFIGPQSSTSSLQQPQPRNFAHYALLASSPPSSASSLTDRSTHTYETLMYGCYVAFPSQKSQSSSTPRAREDDSLPRSYQCPRQQPPEAYHPPYRLPDGQFAIPARCFATSIELCSSSVLLDQLSLPKIAIPAHPKPSLTRFVNAFEAVPDMLRDARPGVGPRAPRTSLAPFLLGHEEQFSYHLSKPQSSKSNGPAQPVTSSVSCATSEPLKNRKELWSKDRQSAVLSLLRVQEIPRVSKVERKREKRSSIENLSKERVSKTARRSFKQSSSSKQKTYAAAARVSGRQDRGHRERQQGAMATRLRIQEARRTSDNSYFLHTSTPNPKPELRRIHAKREYEDSCEEDTEYSSSSTVSSATDTYSRSPEGLSSPECATLKSWTAGSSSSSGQEEDKVGSELVGTDERSAPSRKRLCKMAESFCFGQLENAAFFRAFDEYNRRRRRMSYTLKLEDGEKEARKSRGGEPERRMEVLGSVQNIVYAALQRNAFANNNNNMSGGNVQIRLNGVQEQGAFKVLQKLKECADGTGAIYTNSWRPEELHFLRRCYQNKYN